MIFEPLVSEGFEWVNLCDERDQEVLLSFNGEPRAPAWQPVAVRRVASARPGQQKFKPSDFPWLGSHALCMRSTAVGALRDMLEPQGEILPLATSDGVDLFVYNARIIDALDESRASVAKFPGTNRIMRIKAVAFFESMVRDVDVFRLAHRASSTYVSDRFVERVHASGLKGLDFTKVWPPVAN